MSTMPKNFNLGYFLKEEHIVKGCELLRIQLSQKSFTFKTLDFEIYRREKSIETFDPKKYYKDFISNDLFYNYRSLFYNYEYHIPKGAYGIRKFHFTSFHLLILYYALGFYFYEVVHEIFTRLEPIKKEQKNIFTYYGGKLNYDNPEKSKIYYQNDYTEFNRGIKQIIKTGLTKKGKVCVVKLDIQDFYNCIKTNLLLNVVDKYALPSTKKKLHYDSTTKEAISNLLLFLNKKENGIPLSAQNIISNFISYIFLFELDDYIQKQTIYDEEGFSYFRYVDDFYLIFYRNENIQNDTIGKEIFELSTGISDFLARELDLKINHLKSEKWIIENDDDFGKFLVAEKFTSFADPLKSKDPKTKKPPERLEEVCRIIDRLKKDFVERGKTEIDGSQDIALKEIFIGSIKSYVKSPVGKNLLNNAFKNWNPILTLNSVKALMFLIGNSVTGFALIKKYFETDFEQKMNKTQNVYLLERFINLESYDGSLDKIIVNTKKPKSLYFSLVQRMLTGKNDTEKKYLPIADALLRQNDSLIQQVKMMILAEEEGKFNVAFNHLLNVFHLYCFIKDVGRTALVLKNYDQNEIVIFLRNSNASVEEVTFVMSFFDRRNKNNISHAGEVLLENWIVNKAEYIDYHEKMVNLIVRKIG
jgi:hypothetical protein